MKNKRMGLWLAIGVSIGAAVGVVTDELAVWISIGVALGLIMGMQKKSPNNDSTRS